MKEMSADKILKTLKDQDYEFVDLRFCDTRGKEQHLSLPTTVVDEDLFEEGKMFDGSSIAGWKGINESDMVLMPDAETAVEDPFSEHKTMIIRCDVLEPNTMEGYNPARVRWQSALKPTSRPAASLTPRSSALSRNSSFSTMCATALTCMAVPTASIRRKAPGIPRPSMKAVTPVIVQV
jgi:hypothetical protein